MNKAKKELLNGTFVYFIGNAVVSILQLIILKLITGNIDPNGYGYYDNVIKFDNLITPALTLQISDAVFRNVLRGNEWERKKSITNGSFVIVAGIFLTVIGVFSVNRFYLTLPHCLLVILYIISTNIFAFYQKLSRAVGANLSYVRSNLLKAFFYLVLQILLIYVFKMKEESLFISMILSIVVCIVYLEFSIKTRKYFSFKAVDIMYIKNMLAYSVPLVPNAMLWWFSSSVNSLYTTAKLGLDANGIFTVAGRFSSVIAMIAAVFNLAWQESATKEYGGKNSKNFYFETYVMIYRVLCCAVLLCIPMMRLLLPFMIDQSYYQAILFAPILVIGAGISAMYGFFGQMYSATGKSKGAAVTTFFGVLANLAVILSLTDTIGLWAPSLAIVFSSVVILLMRYYQFRKEMNLKITKDLIFLLLLILVSLPIYYYNNFILLSVFIIISIIVSFWSNKKLVSDFIKLISNKLNHNK